MDDKAAFDRMFNEWYAQFVYFAYYFVNDVEVCRDIVSDAFEYLWRNYYILEACYIHNKKYKEVAEELNVSVAAIHKNIVKALRILREELGQKGNQNEF